jgi:site-specific DNA-methyltransferase (adenine-specific)
MRFLHNDTVCLLTGDCIERMKGLPDASVDAIVTDPPYDLMSTSAGGFMGKEWDATGIAFRPDVWRECLRILKPGGHLLAFGGTRTYHRMAVAIEDAGFEIRDSIHWVYGSGFPKSRNVGGGLGTALKPAHEPVVVARKPLIGTVAANAQQYGTGALNIDACRVQTEDNLNGGAYAKEGKERHDGDENWRFKREGGAGEFQQPAGRWPPNLLLTHLPECDEDTCFEGCPALEMDFQSGIKTNRATGSDAQTSSMFRMGKPIPQGPIYGDTGGASRYFPTFRYQAKANRKEREAGCEDLPDATHGMSGGAQGHGEGYEAAQSIGLNRVKKVKNHHPTVKPIALMEWLLTLVTPEGGTVLDPFMGSGTTGIAAVRKGFEFIGIDMTPEYVEIAEARIAHAKGPTDG